MALISFIFFLTIFQLSSLQNWCETPLKPESISKLYSTLKEEKNIESKQFIEAIIVLEVLSKAKCKMPTFLQIDFKLDALKSRDKYYDLFCSAVESFAQRYQENTNGQGIVAVLTTDEQPLKRSRRAVGAAADVIILSNSVAYPYLSNHTLFSSHCVSTAK